MFKHNAFRITAAMAAFVAAVVAGATQAFAIEPQPEPIGRTTGDVTGGFPPPDVFTVNWALVGVLAVAVIALVGLVYSVAWRASHQGHVHA